VDIYIVIESFFVFKHVALILRVLNLASTALL
jgi:hypothetical protein